MTMHRTPDYKKGSSMVAILLICIGFILYFAAGCWTFIFLITYAIRLPGWLFYSLLALYFGTLFLFASLVYRKGELQRERAILGDEIFFREHPREWKRELKRWKNVSAYRAVSAEQPSDGPAILLGEETQAKELPAYDELYYRISPNALKRDLRMQQFRRRLRVRLTRKRIEPSPYEQRLTELSQKLGNE